MMTSTVLVLLMTIPGLALFYGGLVRPKNMLSVLTHVFYTVCIVTVIWVIYGYSLAFTGGSTIIGGLDKLFLKGVTANSQAATFSVGVPIWRIRLHLLPDDLRRDHAGAHRRRLRRTHEVLGGGAVHPAVGDAGLLPDRAHGLVLGRSGRDRRRRKALAAATDDAAKKAAQAKLDEVMADGGLVFLWGAIDFAGGTVVHINSGIAGLVGALCVGKRIGFGKELMSPHSLVMTMIGASLLWVGWFGFNAGSNLEAAAARRSP